MSELLLLESKDLTWPGLTTTSRISLLDMICSCQATLTADKFGLGTIWQWHKRADSSKGILGIIRLNSIFSSGTGYWGPPMRLLAPAEITVVTLLSTN